MEEFNQTSNNGTQDATQRRGSDIKKQNSAHNSPKRRFSQRHRQKPSHPKREDLQGEDTSEHSKEPHVKIIPLGGLEEVGRNSTVFEYTDPATKKRDIIIVDLGLQFPEEAMMGIDYIIPNISYLKNKLQDLRAIVITHGHMDHIGAIPYLLDKLGNPMIYAGELAKGIMLKRQEDFPMDIQPNIIGVQAGDNVRIGAFEVEFIHVNHNIPDSFSLAIRTPVGTIFHTGDYKFDRNPALQAPADIGRIAHIGKEGVKVLLADSTSVIEEGYSIPEADIEKSLDEIFTRFSKSRLIVATFSTLISRVSQVIHLAEKHGRRVALEGFSMKSNVEIAHELGHIAFDAKTMISTKKAVTLPPNQVVILCPGAQGEGNAALMRIAQREHPHIKLSQSDVVLFSSSVIPGNERSIQGVHDSLARQGAKVINYRMMDIHSGGHAYKEDAKMLLNLVRPEHFIPIHGNHFMLRLHAEIAEELGVKRENIHVLDNGNVANMSKANFWVLKEKVPTNYIMVDGLGVGDVGEIVLRDRQRMAQDGMFAIILIIDSQNGSVKEPIDIISRGFIYMNESRELVNDARQEIKRIVQKTAHQEPFNPSYVRDTLRDELGEFLYERTHRRPLILPVVLKI